MESENQELVAARVRLMMALMRHERATRDPAWQYGQNNMCYELFKECRRRAEELRQLREKYK